MSHAHAAGHGSSDEAYPEASVVAGYAGPYVLLPAFPRFVEPFRVCQELARHAYSVDLSGSDGLVRERGVLHASGAEHRDIDELLDVGDLREVAVQRHVYRRMSPPPGVVGAVVRVQSIRSRRFQQSRRRWALFQAASELLVILPGKSSRVESTHLAGDAVADHYGEILSAGLLNLSDDFRDEAEPVLQASAVLVGPLVGAGYGELVQKVTFMDGVDLHAVYAGFLAHERRLPEGIHQIVDLLFGKSPVLEVRHPDVGYTVGRRHHQRIAGGFVHSGPKTYELGSPEAGSKLEEVLCSVGVYLVYYFLYGSEEDVLLFIEITAAGVLDSGYARDDQSDTSADSGHIVVSDMRVELSVMSEERRSSHGCQDNAVLEGHAADLYRRKKRRIPFLHLYILLSRLSDVCKDICLYQLYTSQFHFN